MFFFKFFLKQQLKTGKDRRKKILMNCNNTLSLIFRGMSKADYSEESTLQLNSLQLYKRQNVYCAA
jgi:hypothetical protein